MTEGLGCTYRTEQENPAFPPESVPVAATKLGFVAKLKTHRGPINRQKSKVSQKSLVARFMAQDPDVLAVFQEMVVTLVQEVGLANEQAEAQAFVQIMNALRNQKSRVLYRGAAIRGIRARSKSIIRSPADFAFGLLLSL